MSNINKSASFKFDFYGLECELDSQNQLFTSLLKAKWLGYQSNKTERLVDKKVKITFKNDLPAKEKATQKITTTWSDTLHQSSDQLSIIHNYLTSQTQVNISHGDILRIDVYFQNSTAFWGLNFILNQILLKQLFQIIIKKFIEQTLLSYVSNQNNLHCLHASAVEKDGQVIVFAGLNGVGKSTLALELVKKYGYKLFADNYLLINEKMAYFSPDQVRLKTESISQLNLKQGQVFGFGKHGVTGVLRSKLKKAKISQVFLVNRGAEWSISNQKPLELWKKICFLQASSGEEASLSPATQLWLNTNQLQSPQLPIKQLTIGENQILPTGLFS
jgi:hypothetical protein